MGISCLGRNSDSRYSFCRPDPAPGVNDKAIDQIREIIYKLDPMPNPNNYVINQTRQIGRYLIVEMNYPDCTSYEGNKILMFQTTLVQLEEQKTIDPHFSKNKKYISPIARFEPTDKGLAMAVHLATEMMKGG